jgi:hypothetical protein
MVATVAAKETSMSVVARYLPTLRSAFGVCASVILIAGCASTASHPAAVASLSLTSPVPSAPLSSTGAVRTGDAALCRANEIGLHAVSNDIMSMNRMTSAAIIHMLNGDQAAIARGDQSDNKSPVVQALGALSQALTDVSGEYAGAMGQLPPSSADPTMTARIHSLTAAVAGTCTNAGVPLTP